MKCQDCLYIPPGDYRSEMYRLSTYAKCPYSIPVKYGELAAAGLYYTGYSKRVKCFSCGKDVDDWDELLEKKWHLSPCGFADGTDDTNIPIWDPNFNNLLKKIAPGFEDRFDGINLRSEADRRETFKRCPGYPAPHLIEELARNGHFYLGYLNRTQCFACTGLLCISSEDDDVKDQHKKKFPRCGFVLGYDVGNIPMPHTTREEAHSEEPGTPEELSPNHGNPPDLPQNQQQLWAQTYPCNNPINRHMVSLQRRIETFNDRWPTTSINAAVKDFATAGFFFLVESDKTKCFYCNMELENWEPGDEPWTEHAKFFPECEFVLRNKGPEFIIAAVSKAYGEQEPFDENKETGGPSSLELPLDLEEREVIQGGTCKICKKNRARIVIMPCGHLCMCEDCSMPTKRCPICKVKILKTLMAIRA